MTVASAAAARADYVVSPPASRDGSCTTVNMRLRPQCAQMPLWLARTACADFRLGHRWAVGIQRIPAPQTGQ